MGFVICLLILNQFIIERPFVKSFHIYNCWTVIKKTFKILCDSVCDIYSIEVFVIYFQSVRTIPFLQVSLMYMPSWSGLHSEELDNGGALNCEGIYRLRQLIPLF